MHMIRLYKSFVWPHLEYASVVWSPYHLGEVKQLERVQKFALKVYSKSWDNTSTYNDMLEISGLYSLEHRRLVGRVCHLFKILNNQTQLFLPPKGYHPQHPQPEYPLLKTIVFQNFNLQESLYHSYDEATIELWNKVVTMVDVTECDLQTIQLLLLSLIIF